MVSPSKYLPPVINGLVRQEAGRLVGILSHGQDQDQKHNSDDTDGFTRVDYYLTTVCGQTYTSQKCSLNKIIHDTVLYLYKTT